MRTPITKQLLDVIMSGISDQHIFAVALRTSGTNDETGEKVEKVFSAATQDQFYASAEEALEQIEEMKADETFNSIRLLHSLAGVELDVAGVAELTNESMGRHDDHPIFGGVLEYKPGTYTLHGRGVAQQEQEAA